MMREGLLMEGTGGPCLIFTVDGAVYDGIPLADERGIKKGNLGGLNVQFNLARECEQARGRGTAHPLPYDPDAGLEWCPCMNAQSNVAEGGKRE